MAGFNDVLRADQLNRPDPPPAPRRALLIGAAGPLGEALLNELLTAHYAEIFVLTRCAIGSSVARLTEVVSPSPVPPPGSADALPVDDVVLALPSGRSWHARDDAYHDLPADLLLDAATRFAADHRRLVVVAPLSARDHLVGMPSQLATETEMALARLPYRSLLFIRPVREEEVTAEGFLPRLVQRYLGTFRYLLPHRTAVLTSQQQARGVAELMTTHQQGIRVVDGAGLHQLLYPQA